MNAPDLIHKLICPSCKVQLELDDNYYRDVAGKTVTCPDCKATVSIPVLSPQGHRPTKPCLICGFEINPDDAFCPGCGKDLRKGQRKVSASPQYYGVEFASPLKTAKDTSNPSSPSVIMGTCPKCNANDIYLVCMNCQKTDSFSLIDKGVECVCGHVMSQIQCPYCSAVIYRKAFRRPNASDKQSLEHMPSKLTQKLFSLNSKGVFAGLGAVIAAVYFIATSTNSSSSDPKQCAFTQAKQMVFSSLIDRSYFNVDSWSVLESKHPWYILRITYRAHNSFGGVALGTSLCCFKLTDKGNDAEYNSIYGVQSIGDRQVTTQELNAFKALNGWDSKTGANSSKTDVIQSVPASKEHSQTVMHETDRNRHYEHKGGFSYIPPDGWDNENDSETGFTKWSCEGVRARPNFNLRLNSMSQNKTLEEIVSSSAGGAKDASAEMGLEFRELSRQYFRTSNGVRGGRLCIEMINNEKHCRLYECIYLFPLGTKVLQLICIASDEDWQAKKEIFDTVALSLKISE